MDLVESVKSSNKVEKTGSILHRSAGRGEETLRWNLREQPDYQYLLGATTTDSFQEVFDDRMFDISLWMARYISLSC